MNVSANTICIYLINSYKILEVKVFVIWISPSICGPIVWYSIFLKRAPFNYIITIMEIKFEPYKQHSYFCSYFNKEKQCTKMQKANRKRARKGGRWDQRHGVNLRKDPRGKGVDVRKQQPKGTFKIKIAQKKLIRKT